MTSGVVYYLPGRTEMPATGSAGLIAGLGWEIVGRNFRTDLRPMGFAEQLETIQTDLQTQCRLDARPLIGQSYGAYLLLHALAGLEPYPGRVLLLSPVLGAALDRRSMILSRPPRAEKLLRWAETGTFPRLGYAELHTGAEDVGCDPRLAKIFAAALGLHLMIVPGAGHELPEAYLKSVLNRFLNLSPPNAATDSSLDPRRPDPR